MITGNRCRLHRNVTLRNCKAPTPSLDAFAGAGDLNAACVQLLQVSIFHGSHVPGLAEASAEFHKAHVLETRDPQAAAASAPALTVRRADDKRSTDKQSLTSYHWAFFQVLGLLLLLMPKADGNET